MWKLSFHVSGTVYRFRENSREPSLSRSARSREKISLPDPAGFNGILESLDDMLLTDNFGKSGGAVFSIESGAHANLLYEFKTQKSKLKNIFDILFFSRQFTFLNPISFKGRLLIALFYLEKK